ncbi:MAG: long-chain fatty acid--CoA ligase [Candidatus Omnitrophota bacterium]|nr:long-chain fatty acid--CoA ligase [Candidatus Omnitrophota bacterium]
MSKTLPQMFLAQAARLGERAVFHAKKEGEYQPVSWKQARVEIEETALGLLDLGIQPGDRVAIFSENRPEWAIADLGILSAGGVTVPIYATLTGKETEYILRNSGARVLFTSNTEMMGKVVHLQKELDLKIVLFDAPYRVSGPRVWWFGELLGLGNTATAQQREGLARQIREGNPEDPASIIYTSGTTGDPKGVVLTHANFLSNCEGVKQVIPIGEEDLLLSFLPLSHVFERMAGYYFVLSVGGAIAYAESLETVPANLLETRPTVITGVPRFYEKTHDRILEAVRSAPPLKRALFRWALRAGSKNRIADRLVLSKLRARLGGRIRFCVSGGAPLPKKIAEFFYAAGILIVEGYGLTETSPVITCNRTDRFRFGTVGLAIPGVEVRIAADGEILTRGPHVMRGYYQNPAATAEVIDAEGWFHTGDVGRLDPDGFLSITDRKKDLIKTSGGKMVAPQNLEAALKADPLIADCVVIGDGRKYLTALVVPNLEKLAGNPEAHALVWERVEQVNRSLASFEQIKKIALLPEPFSLGGGELTPTMKVKRRVVSERYSAQIEELYK